MCIRDRIYTAQIIILYGTFRLYKNNTTNKKLDMLRHCFSTPNVSHHFLLNFGYTFLPRFLPPLKQKPTVRRWKNLYLKLNKQLYERFVVVFVVVVSEICPCNTVFTLHKNFCGIRLYYSFDDDKVLEQYLEAHKQLLLVIVAFVI